MAELDERRLTRRKLIAEEVRAAMGRGIHGRRVTQKELAAAIGVVDSSLSDRLYGRTAFDVDELDRISEYLGVSLEALIRTAGQNLKNLDRLGQPDTIGAGQGKTRIVLAKQHVG